MQNVGENMDDLFRKAADDYMLKEGESNWNEISGQLESSYEPIATVRKKNKTRKYIITGSLLLLCFIAGIWFNQYISKDDASFVVNTKYQNTNKDNNKANKRALPSSKESLKISEVALGKKSKNTSTTLDNSSITTAITDRDLTKSYSINKPGIISNIGRTDKDISSAISFYPLPVIITKAERAPAEMQESATALNNNPVAVMQLQLNKDSAGKNIVINLSVKNKHGFYYGLLAGAGFTTVRNQSFTKPGLDAGLIAGYQFSARSSVEINLLYSHKYYYSDGKYFNTDKMNDMPADMKVMSVKCNSSIFEIPVKFKYNILQKNNSNVYASAGVSSYILMNEKNNYVTSTNGTVGNMNGNYTTTSGYFAGALNISAGYAHNIGTNNTLRFEPYITIPTKGIGIGNLPVSTSGVHVLFMIAPHK
jgi:hypothetical protein